jgi:hypothetical protein
VISRSHRHMGQKNKYYLLHIKGLMSLILVIFFLQIFFNKENNKSINQHKLFIGWNRWKHWEFKLMLKCHCACTSEIGTCINNVGRRCVQKNNENTRFVVESCQTTFYMHTLKVCINMQCKNNLKNRQNQRHYNYKGTFLVVYVYTRFKANNV